MKVSSSWIKELLRRTMLTDRKVAEALEQAGMEVEQIISSSEIDKGVVVALVKKVVQHPEADRLKLVEVGTGEADFRVVCGAPNVREGLKVALAQIGTVLPGGEKIEKAKLRGEISEGMLCSEYELKLGNDHNGILELSSELQLGTPLCDIFPADGVIDLKTPANRFDVLSVVGLAREAGAILGHQVHLPTPPMVEVSTDGPAVEDGAVASRYMLAKVQVDQRGDSPRVISARLRAAGMRSLGPVVDITNYVMLELGQPLHAFDAAKVHPPLAVRPARAGEKLTTLDAVARDLSNEDLVIADTTGPIALAGLMGGAETEVNANTKEILLESAVFDGVTVRKMAKRHGLRTEASARFERGLPVELPPLGLSRAVELLGDVAKGQLVSVTDQVNQKPIRTRIVLSLSKLSKLLGFVITHKAAVEALERLQISVGDSSKEEIVVPEVPWWRPDLRLPEDLVEEVVRVIGYGQVPSTIPSWRPRQLTFDRVRAKRRRVRDLLYGAGLFEVMTYSFVSREQLEALGEDPTRHLKLKNPLSSEQAYLRSSLLPSHLAVLERNRTYAKELGFYEISNVFLRPDKLSDQPDEPVRLAVMVSRPDQAYVHAKGILDELAVELALNLIVKPLAEDTSGAVYAPGRVGAVLLGDREVGRIGQIHPDRVHAMKMEGEAAYFEVDLTPLTGAAVRQFAGVSRLPTIKRDLAVLVPANVTWQVVMDALAPHPVQFVGDYYGEELPQGYKGLTVRLTLVNPDRTPTEAEAADFEAAMLVRLEHKVGAKPRQ